MNNSNPKEPDNKQDTTNYTPHGVGNNPIKNKIYQITTNRVSPKTCFDNPTSLKKHEKALDLEEEELNIIYTSIWIDIQNLHTKLSPSKTSSKIATAQCTSLTSFAKYNCPLSQLDMEHNNLLHTPLRQIFHITYINHKIVGISFLNTFQVLTSLVVNYISKTNIQC